MIEAVSKRWPIDTDLGTAIYRPHWKLMYNACLRRRVRENVLGMDGIAWLCRRPSNHHSLKLATGYVFNKKTDTAKQDRQMHMSIAFRTSSCLTSI